MSLSGKGGGELGSVFLLSRRKIRTHKPHCVFKGRGYPYQWRKELMIIYAYTRDNGYYLCHATTCPGTIVNVEIHCNLYFFYINTEWDEVYRERCCNREISPDSFTVPPDVLSSQLSALRSTLASFSSSFWFLYHSHEPRFQKQQAAVSVKNFEW